MKKITFVLMLMLSVSIIGTVGFLFPDVFNSGPCQSSPCKNGATCTSAKDKFTCHCAKGFKGDTCEECRVKTTDGHCCKFPFNYLWKDHYDCTDAPYVGVNFIFGKNGAAWCLDVNGKPGLCRPYEEPCFTSPCKNNATCISNQGNFTCNCTDGYIGNTCEQKVDPCDSSPCKNGAACESTEDMFTCKCAEGFKGDTCEEKVDPCESSPCKNGATCESAKDKFKCKCAEGYEGDTCEEKVNPCDSSPCKNDATCESVEDKFTCKCAEGFEGNTCEEKVNPCDSSPCKNGATCESKEGNFTCKCAEGFVGETCEEKGCSVKTTKGVCCVFPFKYKKKLYHSCTTVNHGGKPWCATTANYNKDKKWGNCNCCSVKTTKGVCCVFPFKYQKKVYHSCTTVNHGGKPWCATTANYDEDKKWGNCNSS